MALAPDGIIVMHKALQPSSLIPAGFAMVAASSDGDRTTVKVRSISKSSCCPTCGADSHRVHSRYQRRVADLPLAGKSVRLIVEVCRFRCRDAVWAAGSHKGADLWRRLRSQEFRESLRVVTEWASRRRQAKRVDTESLHRVPSARTIASFITTGRDTLSRAETVTVAAVEAGVPTLVEARTVVEGFHEMIRRKTEGDFVPWSERGRGSLVASFTNGTARDVAAVRAAIVTS